MRPSPRDHEKRRARFVRIVESLPEATARTVSGKHLSLEVRGKRFGWLLDNHHGDGRMAIIGKHHPARTPYLAQPVLPLD